MDEFYGHFAWIYDADKNLTPATSVSSIDQLSNWEIVAPVKRQVPSLHSSSKARKEGQTRVKCMLCTRESAHQPHLRLLALAAAYSINSATSLG
jgi:hypothetical protein